MSVDDERPDEGSRGSEEPSDETGPSGEAAPESNSDSADQTEVGDSVDATATLLPATPPKLDDADADAAEGEEPGWLVRNPGWTALIAVLAGVAIGIGAGYLLFDSDDETDSADAVAEEVATLEEAVDTLSTENEELRSQNESLSQQLTASQGEVEQLRERVDQMTGDLTSSVVVLGDFVGQTADQAVAAAEEQGWLVTVTPSETDQAAPGTVISQAPAAGAPMVQGSALVLTVANEPSPPPDPTPDLEYTSVQVYQGTGSQTTDTVTLPTAATGAIRIVYQFQADSRFTVDVIDASETVVATIVDVQGSAAEVTQGAADVPFAGTVAFRVTTENTTQWTMDLQALLPQSTPSS